MGIKIAVRCIEINPLYTHHRKLTIGEWYEAHTFGDIEHMKDTYAIYKDGLQIGLYYRKLFISLAEWRDKQIDSILED